MLVPRSWTWLTVLLLSMFGVAIVLAPLLTFHRTETVRGWLVPDQRVTQIVSQRSGLIEALKVKPGDTVKSGDVLVVLSADQRADDGNSRYSKDAASIASELAEIGKQRKLVRGRFEREQKLTRQQLQRLADELNAMQQQQTAQGERVEVAVEKLSRLEDAANAVPEWRLLEQRDEVSSRRVASQSLHQQRLEVLRERESLESQLASLPAETELRISALREREVRLGRELHRMNSDSRFSLTAPYDGRVADILVAEGETVFAGQGLLAVLPEDAHLSAEVFVSSVAAGFILPDQQVRIAFDAFPRYKFGTTDGTVVQVADYVTLPGEAPQALKLREAAYRANVVFDDSPLPLRPGMTLGAELVLEERSVLDWLLEPLLSRGG